ncbi:hypothetical protein DFJ73DRAFT_761251 [Zopfochytrium polystomum]|nr:hypothetical protein DFJ73DRAFT_761251 [Zopfochytrium polystomum]
MSVHTLRFASSPTTISHVRVSSTPTTPVADAAAATSPAELRLVRSNDDDDADAGAPPSSTNSLVRPVTSKVLPARHGFDVVMSQGQEKHEKGDARDGVGHAPMRPNQPQTQATSPTAAPAPSLSSLATSSALAQGTAAFPPSFDISTTLSTHYATQFLFNNSANPYHKLDPPFLNSTGEVVGSRRTTVACGITVNRIYNIEPKTGSFILDMDVYLAWSDPRLAFTNPNVLDPAGLELDPHLPWKP